MGRKDWLIDLGSGCGWKRKKGEGIVVVERFGGYRCVDGGEG